jgi:hypothetical protein
MNDIPTSRTTRTLAPHRFEIRVIGHLAPRWATWFDGMTLSPEEDGTTVICGPVADQSALHGLLRKLGDLGLTLVSVAPSPAQSTPDPTHQEPPTTRSST